MLGALPEPEQHVGSLARARAACWEPSKGSKLGALPGQQNGDAFCHSELVVRLAGVAD